MTVLHYVLSHLRECIKMVRTSLKIQLVVKDLKKEAHSSLRLCYFEVFVACENSRPSSLPARVAFREKDVCDLPPKIPY